MSPTLNGSSVIWRFECSNVMEIRNRIISDFYNVHRTATYAFNYVCMSMILSVGGM